MTSSFRISPLVFATLLITTSSVEAQIDWRRISFGLSDAQIQSIVFNDRGTPFAATADGIIRVDSATMTGEIVSLLASNFLFAFDDGTMISLGDGVFQSSDDGMTWTRLHAARTEGAVTAAPDGTLYRRFLSKLSRSTDTARSWQLLDTADTAYTHSVIALRDGSILATSRNGLRRSADKGATWSQISSELIGAIVETPVGALVGVVANRAARSTDGGFTWANAQPLTFSSIVVARDGTLFGIESEAYEWERRGTYRSTDDGRSWTLMMTMRPFLLAAESRASIWWVHGNRVYHYDSSVRQHTRVAIEPHMYRGRITDVAVDPGGTLYAATPTIVETGWMQTIWHSALSRSTDNGSTWSLMRDSIDGYVLAPYSGTVLARGSNLRIFPDQRDDVDTWMLRSTDGGNQWSTVIGSPRDVSWRPNGLIAVASLPTNLFEGYTYVGALMISSDSGRTFRATATADYWRSVLITRTGTIVAGAMASGGGAGIREAAHLRSADNGATWTRSTDSLVFTELSEGRDGTLFAVGCTLAAGDRGGHVAGFAGIYRSTDDGATWTSQLDSVGYSFATSAFVYTRSGTILAHLDYRFFRSSDNGSSWTEISIGEYRYPHSIHLDSSDALLIASGNMIHRSTDGGIVWSVLSDGVPSGAHSKLVIASDGALIVATSDDGLWRSNGPASIDMRSSVHTVTLNVTPNPLRSYGSVTLALERRVAVHASLCDAVGRRVVSVFNGELDAGSHTLPLDVTPLSAGAYLLHIRHDDISQTRLVIVE